MAEAALDGGTGNLTLCLQRPVHYHELIDLVEVRLVVIGPILSVLKVETLIVSLERGDYSSIS